MRVLPLALTQTPGSEIGQPWWETKIFATMVSSNHGWREKRDFTSGHHSLHSWKSYPKFLGIKLPSEAFKKDGRITKYP